jgi:hypothetical protein
MTPFTLKISDFWGVGGHEYKSLDGHVVNADGHKGINLPKTRRCWHKK